MSVLDERFTDDSVAGRAVDWLSTWYHVFVVVGLFGFMFWLRARTWENFVVDGNILFSGNDAWYHLRQVSYTVTNWPNTMPFDAWTEFPFGTSVSQFGTFYDQLIATAALIVGLGNPSDQLIRMVHLFAPAVFGAAIVVPTYYLGKHVGDRIGGVIAAVLVALSGGELLRRSLVGFSDHHVAEVFFQVIAVLAILIALRVAQREKPVYELFVDRDWESLRRPLGWSAIAGAALALYMSVWPPGTLLVGILGVYVTLQLPLAYLRGESPEHVGIAAGTIFGVAGLLSLASLDSVGLGMTETSLVQPGLAIAGVLWVGALSWLARVWDSRDLDTWQYPVTVFGSLIVGVGLVAVLLPDVFWYFVDQLLRFVGFAFNPHTGSAVTVGEVQPLPIGQADTLISWLGITPLIAGIGVVLALAHQYTDDELDPAYLFVALWFVLFVAATFTQQRFAYYLTVPAATMTALVVTRLFRYLRSFSETDGVETYQLLVVGSVVVALVVPMVFLAPTALDRSAQNGPGGIQGWQSSLEYMETETPAVGNYGGAGNADQMNFYGTYERTDDFEYPDGAYGVLSWWDYGHWITQEGERIPVANPFQGNARQAASFLIAQNESQASDALEVVSEETTDAQTRYVMVDWKMATTHGGYPGMAWGKFFAPPNFVDGVDESTYFRRVRGLAQTQRGTSLTGRYFTVHKQAYYETMVVRLYRYHGSAASTTNAMGTALPSGQIPVVDWEDTEVELTDGSQATWHIPARNQNGSAQSLRLFDNRTAAEQFVEQDGTAQIGGLGKIPSEPVPALQHYRLVQVDDMSQNPFIASQPGLAQFARNQQLQSGVDTRQLTSFAEPYSAWTKVFERVPGATVEGEGPANANVTASVEMEIPNSNQTFRYRQQAETGPDGQFSMTLPYSTEGYENWGPENGYTNVSVRATGPYQFTVGGSFNETGYLIQYTGQANVTEAQVIGEDESPVTVELQRQQLGQIGGDEGEDGGETGDGDGSTDGSGNSTDGSESLPADPSATIDERRFVETAPGGTVPIEP
ncbi:oligosaccharyl transferase, archaeosortase A system-associated [Halorhabdus amylolytica]|uniref:oligosaccharyl transferase, archaeosortase A system-associated n=1 Tax=Halorhabdus amylolytica TaxID=2559573 RepID=UPI0010AA1555|nr:oligosaccharyl transferase, archaeosortase A system-associated [Halorhabdus amylolytica]